MLDPRIVKVGIQVGDEMYYFTELSIKASGTKFANGIDNEATVVITNLTKETRDYLLTETSPFNKEKKTRKITLEVGRESVGTALLFEGDIIQAMPSQPPDIEILIKALTQSAAKGDVVSRGKAGETTLKAISSDVARDLGLNLIYEAKDKKISNYSFTGGKLKQVEALGDAGNVNAYVDDDKLIVKDMDVPLNGKSRFLDLESGMIGIPELTEHGIKVKFLYDNDTAIGGELEIKSKLNPAADGKYIIYKLSFDIANRDNQFYMIAEAKRRDSE